MPAFPSFRSMTLFVQGVGAGSGEATLFVAGSAPESGGVPLFVGGSGDPVTGSGAPPLSVWGHESAAGGTTLFVHGHATASGGMTLWTSAATTASGQTTLFAGGHERASGAHPLHLWGHDASAAGLSVYLFGGDVPAASGGPTLVVAGASTSGFTGGVDLHVYSDPSGNVKEAGLPLWVGAFDPQPVVRNVNLWVGGEAPAAARGATLAAWNDQSGVALGAPLFVSGDGVTAGALADARGMNLYVERTPANGLTLYLATPGTPATTGTSLFVGGSAPAALGAPLAMPQAVGGPTQAVRLFTSGW